MFPRGPARGASPGSYPASSSSAFSGGLDSGLADAATAPPADADTAAAMASCLLDRPQWGHQTAAIIILALFP